MSHWYLTLPSNSSHAFFPNNALTSFSTRLHSTYSLTGDWEVALVGISFPRTWYTVETSKPKERTGGWFSIASRGHSELNDFYHEARIPSGYYESIPDVIRAISEAIAGLPTPTMHALIKGGPDMTLPDSATAHLFPKIKYARTSKKCSIEMHPKQTIHFSPTLATLLGLSYRQNPFTMLDINAALKGDMAADINRGINSLFVYCDLLEHVPVGDTKVPLLRTVDASGKNGEIINVEFQQLRYIPVQKKNFDTIEILIRDDLGQPIAFESGKLIVTLHFREAKSKYYL